VEEILQKIATDNTVLSWDKVTQKYMNGVWIALLLKFMHISSFDSHGRYLNTLRKILKQGSES
jgi:hypothetical protein